MLSKFNTSSCKLVLRSGNDVISYIYANVSEKLSHEPDERRACFLSVADLNVARDVSILPAKLLE